MNMSQNNTLTQSSFAQSAESSLKPSATMNYAPQEVPFNSTILALKSLIICSALNIHATNLKSILYINQPVSKS